MFPREGGGRRRGEGRIAVEAKGGDRVVAVHTSWTRIRNALLLMRFSYVDPMLLVILIIFNSPCTV